MTIPISASARGQMRQTLSRLQGEADRVLTAASAIPRATLAAACSSSPITRRRGVASVVRRMPITPICKRPTEAAWRVLEVRGGDRPGVMVMVILLGSAGRPPMAREPFGLFVSYHALGRLLDRSRFVADPAEAVRQAHDAMLRLPAADGGRLLNQPDILLPTAGGAFLAATERFGPTEAPLAVCRTWVSSDQLHVDQEARLKAWPHPVSAA